MQRLIFFLFFAACTNFKMANIPKTCSTIHVLPIQSDGGALLQRHIATKLIESGYSIGDSSDASIICRVNMLDDSCNAVSNRLKGKAQRAKHHINIQVSFEDGAENLVLEPFKLSVDQFIGFIDPVNFDSLSTNVSGQRLNTFEFSMGQSRLLEQSHDTSRQALFHELASKIVMHLQTKIDENTFSLNEVLD